MCHLYSHKQRHTVQTLDIHLHVMHAHLRRVHTWLRDTSTFTKKRDWICKNAPTEQNCRPLFIQVCVWGSDQNFNPSPQTHREWLTAVVVFLSSAHSAIPQLSFFSSHQPSSLWAPEKLHCHMHNSYSEAFVGNQLLNCQAASDKKLKAQDEWILQVKWDVQE